MVHPKFCWYDLSDVAPVGPEPLRNGDWRVATHHGYSPVAGMRTEALPQVQLEYIGVTSRLKINRSALLAVGSNPIDLKLAGEVGLLLGLGSQASWTVLHSMRTSGLGPHRACCAIDERVAAAKWLPSFHAWTAGSFLGTAFCDRIFESAHDQASGANTSWGRGCRAGYG